MWPLWSLCMQFQYSASISVKRFRYNEQALLFLSNILKWFHKTIILKLLKGIRKVSCTKTKSLKMSIEELLISKCLAYNRFDQRLLI